MGSYNSAHLLPRKSRPGRHRDEPCLYMGTNSTAQTSTQACKEHHAVQKTEALSLDNRRVSKLDNIISRLVSLCLVHCQFCNVLFGHTHANVRVVLHTQMSTFCKLLAKPTRFRLAGILLSRISQCNRKRSLTYRLQLQFPVLQLWRGQIGFPTLRSPDTSFHLMNRLSIIRASVLEAPDGAMLTALGPDIVHLLKCWCHQESTFHSCKKACWG